MLIHNDDSSAPQTIMPFHWHGLLVYYGIPVLVNLVILIIVARYFSRYLTGEWRGLRDPQIIIVTAIIWPFMDGLAIMGAIFWLAGRAIAPLVRPVQAVPAPVPPVETVAPPQEEPAKTLFERVRDDDDGPPV